MTAMHHNFSRFSMNGAAKTACAPLHLTLVQLCRYSNITSLHRTVHPVESILPKQLVHLCTWPWSKHCRYSNITSLHRTIHSVESILPKQLVHLCTKPCFQATSHPTL